MLCKSAVHKFCGKPTCFWCYCCLSRKIVRSFANSCSANPSCSTHLKGIDGFTRNAQIFSSANFSCTQYHAANTRCCCCLFFRTISVRVLFHAWRGTRLASDLFLFRTPPSPLRPSFAANVPSSVLTRTGAYNIAANLTAGGRHKLDWIYSIRSRQARVM